MEESAGGPGGDQQCHVDLPGSGLGREDGRQELEGSEDPRKLLLFKEGTPEYISRLRGGPLWAEEEEGGEEFTIVPGPGRQGPGPRQPLVWARPQAWPSFLAFRCHGHGGLYCGTDFLSALSGHLAAWEPRVLGQQPLRLLLPEPYWI